MRCKFCGSESLHQDKQHSSFSGGKAITGAVVFGPVGAVAGFVGKDRQGYRCGACGAFSDSAMDAFTEAMVNGAVRDAENGKSREMFDYYKSQFPNIHALIPEKTSAPVQSSAPVPAAYIPVLPEKSAESIKRSYRYGFWQPGSPVFVEAVIIKSDSKTDSLSLIAWNDSSEALRSAYFNVRVLDDTGDEILSRRCVYQNLSVAAKQQLPAETSFPLGTDLAFSVELFLEKAAFENGSVWRSGEEGVYELPAQTAINESNFPRFKYISTEYTRRAAPDTLYIPAQTDKCWLCCCGHANRLGEPCSSCSESYESAVKALDQQQLIKTQHDAVFERAAERAEKTMALYNSVQDKIAEENNKKLISRADGLIKENTVDSLEKAIEILEGLKTGDAAEKLASCRKQLEEANQKLITQADALISENTVESLEKALAILESIKSPAFAETADSRRKDIEEANSRLFEEAERKKLEAEKKLEEEKAAREEQSKKAVAKSNKIAGIFAIVVLAAFAYYFFVGQYAYEYRAGVKALNSGKYYVAMMSFASAKGYKDSDELLLVAKYEYAVDSFYSGNYYTAISYFKQLKGYKDSDELLLAAKYNYAVDSFNTGDYATAISYFKQLNGYKDSDEQLANVYAVIQDRIDSLSAQRESEYTMLTMGKYNGSPVEWMVIARDGDRALVISRYILDTYKYSTGGVIWKDSEIRSFLNDSFYNTVFSSEEQALIISTDLSTNGETTNDKLFLLSTDEVKLYFSDDTNSRKCTTITFELSEYSYDICESFLTDGGTSEGWWLRDLTSDSTYQLTGMTGSISYYLSHAVSAEGIRPAMWIEYSD